MKLVDIAFDGYILIVIAVFAVSLYTSYTGHVEKAIERRRTRNFYSGSTIAEFKAGGINITDIKGKPIGSITAIEGEVSLSHEGDTVALPAILGDRIYLYDHIQTMKQSRVQILLKDETLLNLTEDAYIQIKEHIYSPEEKRGSLVIRVLRGKVRGIVGRYFRGAGSRVIISTPTDTITVKHGSFAVDVASR